MGPPPFSSRLEPDNLPELRTIMEPTRDAVPQLPLTTTPASTTAGHAPDIYLSQLMFYISVFFSMYRLASSQAAELIVTLLS